MNIEEVKKQYLQRDKVVRVLAKDGFFRAAAIKNTKTALTAQKNHNLPAIPAEYLSKALSAVSLVTSFLKGEERLIIDLSSKGKISRIFVEAIHTGEVRGFVNYSEDISAKNQNINFLEKGLFQLTRILYNRNEPLTGVIEIDSDDFSKILTDYFEYSEQIPTIARLYSKTNEKGEIVYSGGFIVQALPGVSENDINNLKKHIVSNEMNIEKLLDNEYNPEKILNYSLPFKYELIKSSAVDFFCRCSKENFMQKLLTLDVKEIISLEKENQNELVCQYCNKHYYLQPEDFAKLKNDIYAQKN